MSDKDKKSDGKLTLSAGSDLRALIEKKKTQGSKTVIVEVKRSRLGNKGGRLSSMSRPAPKPPAPKKEEKVSSEQKAVEKETLSLTEKERQARMRAARSAQRAVEKREESLIKNSQRAQESVVVEETIEDIKDVPQEPVKTAHASVPKKKEKEVEQKAVERKTPSARRVEPRRRSGKITITQALQGDLEESRARSLSSLRRAREKDKKKVLSEDASTKVSRTITLPEVITVQELANRMAEKAGDVIKSLMKMGMMSTITQSLDADTAELLAQEYGHKVKRVSDSDVEDLLTQESDKPEELQDRPPVVTIMGHVDHGKTSLLDAIRKANVAAGEKGGITQHIGAYQVASEGGVVTFVDTPGHEAFTAMRARGAKVTDIVVLVVAADDGVKAQTIEAINHAKAAEVPIIVAINKMDKPEANPERVKQELLQYDVILEDFGGDVLSCEISAKTGQNLKGLLDNIVLQGEMLSLKGNPSKAAAGVVVDSYMAKGQGAVCTVLVQQGVLTVGDIFVAGKHWGRVRTLCDDSGKRIKKAKISMPVSVSGGNGVPDAGDIFSVVPDEQKAREISDYRVRVGKASLDKQDMSVDALFSSTGEKKIDAAIAVVIKADVHGSAEAIVSSLKKLDSESISVKVLHAAVGEVSEADVTLAEASGGFVVAFNVRANAQARELSRQKSVDIEYHGIIYEVIDSVKARLTGMVQPEVKETVLGEVLVKQVYKIQNVGRVAGCQVQKGVIKVGENARVFRDGILLHKGKVATLQRVQDAVKEVHAGVECGLSLENYQDVRKGDVIECFAEERIEKSIFS